MSSPGKIGEPKRKRTRPPLSTQQSGEAQTPRQARKELARTRTTEFGVIVLQIPLFTFVYVPKSAGGRD